VTDLRVGLRANARQFALLVGITALVGALAGLERSVLPLVGEEEYGLASRAGILAFVAAFGASKALANLFSGPFAERRGRKRVLVAGWVLVLPVAPLIALASSWETIVVANLLLGAGQGLAWSMTVVMKIDLVGPVRRGLALGLNESAGYVGVAVAAFATGAAAATVAPRTTVWVGATMVSALGLALSVLLVRDTSDHAEQEQGAHGRGDAPSLRRSLRAGARVPVLRACAQAGFFNNLNDAVIWGLVPLYLAAHGASVAQIGVAAGLYPAVWGLAQIASGWASDHLGRKGLIVAGMLVQGAAYALLVAGGGELRPSLLACVLLGLGTALVYPTLIAAVSDVVTPRERASALGVYRFWRDAGFVGGAVALGLLADAMEIEVALAVTGAVTALSGIWVAFVHFPRLIVEGDGRHRTIHLERSTERA
jgi:MFS family permease